MKDEQVRELLYQMLETEVGGVQIYTTALRCAENEDLKEEWEEYLEQTQNHVTVVQDAMRKLGLDTEEETPGRKVVRHIGESLVQAMELNRDRLKTNSKAEHLGRTVENDARFASLKSNPDFQKLLATNR